MNDEPQRPGLGELRASDKDREAVVERLRLALNEGRLSLFEWDERIALAYRASTYAELERLSADLPREPVAPVPVGLPSEPSVTGLDRVPTALKVLWTIWLSAVLINLVVWLLVSLSSMSLIYFWPIWVAGPAGAALAGVTIGIDASRGSRQRSAARRRAEQAARKAAKRAR
ncbi:MAG TPA: DUF1707 domain-containing protein [Jatrophihabitans sp.]|nr:DUF1707 domain-containing protein [Jatrophihabitans sp.]